MLFFGVTMTYGRVLRSKIGVDTCRVCHPEINVDAFDWFTSIDVGNLHIEKQINTGLSLTDVFADKHAGYI